MLETSRICYAWAKKDATSMPPLPAIKIKLLIPSSEYRAYEQAARILTRLMGRSAPSVEQLIQTQLTGRDATGVADDYLDLIGWPPGRGRVISLGRTPPTNRKAERRAAASKRQGKAGMMLRFDPSCN